MSRGNSGGDEDKSDNERLVHWCHRRIARSEGEEMAEG